MMKGRILTDLLSRPLRRTPCGVMLLLAWLMGQADLQANPANGTVTQGTATISPPGPQRTINQSSGTAFINWQSFNIGFGETVTFNQPSATSVTWNYINDPNNPGASTINGTLNANGYVVLQNPNGFMVGGTASITAHGLVMTTAATPALNLSGGGAWSFNAPPPSAQIINLGQINITGGGSAFLIASDIENNGTISAPGGRIGLYAGQKVLVSMSPDGRGLSAQVTLPEGSVDNKGNLIADAGSIVAQAQFVNQNGLVQANSIQNVNGTIELVASDSLSLGANSVVSANGDSTATTPSPGGFVVLKSDNAFADVSGSMISVSGQAGGQDGIVEIFGNGVSAGTLQSSIGNNYALLINPYDVTLSSGATDASSTSPNLNVGGLSAYAQIDLQALDNIELDSSWTLADAVSAATLGLTSGNNITLNSSLTAGNNWNVNMTAGAQQTSGGIYLNGGSSLQAQNGNIDLWAAHEVMIVNNGAIRTVGGGNISVTAETGDVNTGDNVNGYLFGQRATTAPYYRVNTANLGGISTAAGGNVTITAGRDIISYLPVQGNASTDPQNDAGTGAFGPQPGNVTITAGRNVSGHYVLANGVGSITAGGNIGAPLTDQNQGDGFALSLINGGWSIYAPNGNIYLQEVRNPNGIFGELKGRNASNYGGWHLFDYNALASVLLDAGGSVEITGADLPRLFSGGTSEDVPIILPPSFEVITGSGDFVLDASVILFPSADQNLNLAIGRNFVGNASSLEMSDSAASRWIDDNSFGMGDHSTTLTEANSQTPVEISVGGDMTDVNLYTTKATQIMVGGDMVNSSFVGKNLQSSGPMSITSISVGGQIYYTPKFSYVGLSSGITSADPLLSSAWDSVFALAVDPSILTDNTFSTSLTSDELKTKLDKYLLFSYSGSFLSSTLGQGTSGLIPNFVYDNASHTLGSVGPMSTTIKALLDGPLTVLKVDASGKPIIDSNGHLETTTYTFASATAIDQLYQASAGTTTATALGLQIGGPGQFKVHAGSIDLGNSGGIGSSGFGISGLTANGFDYASLQSLLPTAAEGGASVTVDVDGNLTMFTSGIYSRDGGNVTVNAGGEIDLSQGNFVFPTSDCYGIYTSGHSDVSVTANGDVNIGSARIGTFDGGNVFVESYNGAVNAGNGANIALTVYGFYLDPTTGLPTWVEFGDLTDITALKADPAPYGSGILAEYPTSKYQTSGGNGQPGNITIITPNGNIVSGQGGISQFALDQSIAGGPVVSLTAGTTGVDATDDQGNVLIDGAVIGGTVNVTASGKITGFFVSRQNLNVKGYSFSGVAIAGQQANFSTSQSGGPTLVVGIGGVNAQGLGPATLLGQNVSVDGGASQSTLGTSVSATAASQSAAQQASQSATEQVTGNDNENNDKKKEKEKPLIRHVGRVTVILSAAVSSR